MEDRLSMPAPVDRSASRVALLTIRAGDARWAFPSAAVASVEPFDADSAETALDLLPLLGTSAAALFEAWRVLVLVLDNEQLRLLVRGALDLTELPARSLLPLPAELTSASPLVTHVALVDGKPSLLVVSPERLLSVARTAAAATTPFSTSPEAHSC